MVWVTMIKLLTGNTQRPVICLSLLAMIITMASLFILENLNLDIAFSILKMADIDSVFYMLLTFKVCLKDRLSKNDPWKLSQIQIA